MLLPLDILDKAWLEFSVESLFSNSARISICSRQGKTKSNADETSCDGCRTHLGTRLTRES